MICGIALAAGRSRRMGARGQKLLLPYAGNTVIGHVVDQLLDSALDRIIVVVRRDDERVAAALAGRPLEVVVNPALDDEMLSSARCGIRALPPECQAVLMALGDQPEVSAALVDRLLAAFAASPKGILVPSSAGRLGHPLMFAARYYPEILDRYDGEGLRGLLRDHLADVQELKLSAAEMLADIDTPTDYERALNRIS